jgi:UPF0042 nucleotide-binding protein
MARLVIITGQSGAGRTLILRAFEDLGYFCVDNLPPALLLTFAELLRKAPEVVGAAIVIDVRGGNFFEALDRAMDDLAEAGQPYTLLFLEASDSVLLNRYKASRRAHPMGSRSSLPDAIRRERERLMVLRGRADILLDTSTLSPQQARDRVAQLFGLDPHGLPFQVRVISFGYKYGIPLDADLVFDVRFLPNPHYVADLRPRTGRDQAVQDYVLNWPVAQGTLQRLSDLLDFLLPLYRQEGKASLAVAIGCTGGRHRSVVVADRLAGYLDRQGLSVEVEHRDVDTLPDSDDSVGGRR